MHPIRRCDGCGQEDDHPRIVVGNRPDGVNLNYHLDCPNEWQGDADPAHVAAAQAGVHGDELRALILGGNQ